MAVTVRTNYHLDRSTAAASGGFPTASTVGITDPGWTPSVTYNNGLTISTDNTLVENALIKGRVIVENGAANVTIRNCRILTGDIFNIPGGMEASINLLVEDCDILWDDGVTGTGISDSDVALGSSNFTVRRTKIIGFGEGIRIGWNGTGAGPTVIEDTYVEIHEPDSVSGWHGDGLQTWQNEHPCTITNSVIRVMTIVPQSNAAVYFTDDGALGSDGKLTINGLVCGGGGITVRLVANAVESVEGLYIIEDDWLYGPLATFDTTPAPAVFDCHLCTLDGNGQPIPGTALAWTDG